jgi:3-oxoadipate enol-lactonase
VPLKARLAGSELHYDVRGDGPALLFLHAFPLGLFMWEGQARAFAATHRVIRFDARGFGATAAGDGPLSMERIADDAALLLDHLGIGQAVVAGCSMGGYVAFAMVRRHRDRLRGLVLQNTRSGADTLEARGNRGVLAAKVLKEGAGAAADAFLPRLLGASTRRERPQLEAGLRDAILETSPRGIANALLGLGARADSNPTLREIAVPTLVLGGTEDVLTPPAEAEAMAAAISGSQLTILPAAGHLANLENPEAYDAALAGFLRRA